MIPKSETLPCGYRVVPYIYKGRFNFEISQRDMSLCDNAIYTMSLQRGGDRLDENYSGRNLHLKDMHLYNFVFDGIEPVLASGAQYDGDSIRVFSRYFGFNNYRTNGKILLDKVDDFDELKYTLRHLDNKLIYWSRDKSPKFFERLKAGRPDIFSDWKVHPDKVNIMRTAGTVSDNYQSIFYTGDINEIL
tara:strand:+ start:26659 stop:27228 length:570 start_codon:yes stop_codon:yes gene_type:complete